MKANVIVAGVGIALTTLAVCALHRSSAAESTAPTNVEEILAEAGAAYAQKDYAEAFRLNLKAAELGSPQAQSNVGAFYQDGFGVVAPNFAEALKWYRMAVSGGNVQAKKNIGDLYKYDTVPSMCKDRTGAVSPGCFWKAGAKDGTKFAEAMKWYRAAAEDGNTRAMIEISWLFANGYGVSRDCASAKRWLDKAAAAGDETASTNLRSGVGNCRWSSPNPR